MPLFKSSGSFLFLFQNFKTFLKKVFFFYQTNFMSFTSEVHIRIERKKNLITISLLFLFFLDCQYLFFLQWFEGFWFEFFFFFFSKSNESFCKKNQILFFFPSNAWERTRIMQRTIIWQKKMFWNQKNYF